MNRKAPAASLLALFAVGIAAAQSDPKKELANTLQKELVGKIYTLNQGFREGGILKADAILHALKDGPATGKELVRVDEVLVTENLLMRKEWLEVRATRVCLAADPDQKESVRVREGSGLRVRIEFPKPYDPQPLRDSLKRILLDFDAGSSVDKLPESSKPPSELDGKPIYRIGEGGVEAPECITCPIADYSDEARQAGVDGVVVIWAVIDEEGSVRDIGLLKPLGCGLDEEAMRAVRGWKLKPARRNGQPVALWMTIETDFHISKEP